MGAMLDTEADIARPASVDADENLKQLRAEMLQAHASMSRLQDAIQSNLQARAGAASTRAGYLHTLESQIGLPPERDWRDEWVQLSVEHFRLTEGTLERKDQAGATIKRKAVDMTDEELEAHVLEVDHVQQYIEWGEKRIAWREKRGWSREDSVAYQLLFQRRAPMARALAQGDRRFAASTYALCSAIFNAARRQEEQGAECVPKRVYANVRAARKNGRQMLTSDPRWAELEQPDRNGFCGLTCCSLVRFFDEEGMWSEEGICVPDAARKMVPQASEVIMVEAAAEDEAGLHTPVQVRENEFVFPPNTLFRLRGAAPSFVAPSGVRVQQRLLTTSATFRCPHADADAAVNTLGSKLCSVPVTLQYQGRAAYISGIDDVVLAPALDMALECARSLRWQDWKGASYVLSEEWAYVCGAAACKEATPGTRDRGNAGMRPEEFRARANQHIRARRAQRRGAALPDAHAFLSLEEVLAVRLYSGPAFQPINDFLRAIAQTRGAFRTALARDPGLTFAATVGHLCRAIRKLAAVAEEEEAQGSLFRGVRGELPRAFWVPDESGLVCATDMAFMSTSRNRRTPVAYMADGGPNVLWELRPARQDDAGFHCGADIALLSQFAEEQEVLFPPCTMLQVLEDHSHHNHNHNHKHDDDDDDKPGAATLPPRHPPSDQDAPPASPRAAPLPRPASSGSRAARCWRLQHKTQDRKQFLAVQVRPSFV